MNRSLLSISLLAILGAASAPAQDESTIKFKGAQVFYEFGTIFKGLELGLDTIDNMFTQRFGGTFDVHAARGEHLNLFLGAGSIFWHAIPEVANQTASQVFYGDAILTKAFGQFDMGGTKELPTVQAKLGFFPVKYSYSRNLGEYLFRTGTYPSFLVTGNGFTAVNTSGMAVLGTQWTHNITPSLTHDLFFTSERQTFPLHDFSLSYLIRYKGGFLNAGLGLQLERLIPVRPSSTTTSGGEAEKSTYFEFQGETYANNPEWYHYHAKADSVRGDTVSAAPWTAKGNLVTAQRAAWEADPSSKPELKKYSFKGIKPLVMLALDFGALFEGVFRKDEMVLYAEGVLMGWENKPIYYTNRMDRLAMMAGFNIPTFGILDNFNVEAEYLASPYVNGYRNARDTRIPLPDYNYFSNDIGYDPETWKGDNLKWSIFLNRTIMKGLNLQAQLASDHLRGRRHTRVVSEQSILIDDDHWYAFLKVQANI